MDELYRQELLELYRNPTNKGKMLNPDLKTEDSNPLCGDQVEIQLRLDKNNKIIDALFDGKGCVISMASTSLLLDKIKGKTLEQVSNLTREEILDMIGINLTPSRIKCAMLPLVTLKKGIIEKRNNVKITSELPIKKEIKIKKVKKK
ncbi:MAG: iron-sulfur cluster assembly scaffold protein [Candidatus Woesearchaeota archaeon]|jgi:nitrogen fixation NifU-like protein